MRVTIERLRTLVAAAAILLLLATVGFLAVGKFRNPLKTKDLPQKLGIEIQQDAKGVTFSHALGGHSQFKLHANQVVQLREGNALLHGVEIELYGEDGRSVDHIEGAEFEYNKKEGTAVASGPVEITLMRPGVAPAIAPKAVPGQMSGGKDSPLEVAAKAAAAGQIHVKTSGLNINLKSGQATTTSQVDFTTAQGSGSAMGATFDRKIGHLILERAVTLSTQRANTPVQLRAAHAEFTHADMICEMRSVTVDYRDGQALANLARIEFRENGSATHIDASQGFQFATKSGSRLQAARGHIEFNEHNQPQHAEMEGGVTLDSDQPGRKAHGSAPSAHLDFTAKGDLRHVRMETGVELTSEETGHSNNAKAEPLHIQRTWHSPTVDVDFRPTAHGSVEPSTLVGTGGVTIFSQSQRGKAAAVVARLAADQVNGQFAAGNVLNQLYGSGHARMEQTLASGAHQTATGDRLEAHFSPLAGLVGNLQVETAQLDGHVTLLEQQPTKPGTQPDAPLRAFAAHALYAADGQWLHLTGQPRIDHTGLQLAAEKIDISQESGDAFAHGNVKATWTQSARSPQLAGVLSPTAQDPAHVVASEAHVHQAAGNSVATFRGHARLWQQANSVTAPVLVLDKGRQSLEAHSSDRNEPVRLTLLSQTPRQEAHSSTAPAVIRARGGDLHYSGLDRMALMQGGALGQVLAETPTASSQSDQVELKLTQPAKATVEATPKPVGDTAAQGQVERMIARGHLSMSSQGRRGTGEQLVYTGASGEYRLTGTPTVPPRITDPVRGTVSGATLIFRSRDDSVSIEGGGRPTTTQTVAPR